MFWFFFSLDFPACTHLCWETPLTLPHVPGYHRENDGVDDGDVSTHTTSKAHEWRQAKKEGLNVS